MKCKVVNSVTVIVPHHNRPQAVREALLSIHKQTVQPQEVILVDDNSSLEHRTQILELAQFATIITTPTNLGPAGARNLGAQKANSEWIAFLDDDDQFLPDKQELQIAYIEDHPHIKALGGGLLMVTPEGKQQYWGKKPTRKLSLSEALCYTASMPQALMIRRDLFLELGGFDSSMVPLEDRELGVRLIAAGHEMHFLAEPLFLYHHGGDRPQLSAVWRKMWLAEMRMLNKHADLARREFGGRLGAVRMKARCCKMHGTWKGGPEGRIIWALGCALEALTGQPVRA